MWHDFANQFGRRFRSIKKSKANQAGIATSQESVDLTEEEDNRDAEEYLASQGVENRPWWKRVYHYILDQLEITKPEPQIQYEESEEEEE